MQKDHKKIYLRRASGGPASEWPDESIGFVTHDEELGDRPPYLAQLPTNASATEHWNNIKRKTGGSTDLVDGVDYWRADKRKSEFYSRK